MTDQDRTLSESVGKFVGAAADLGVALARAADAATAGGREPAPAKPGESAVTAIIRHGVATVTNIVGQAVAATQSARTQAAAGGPPAPSGAQAASRRPRVRPGDTLRVPLLVENPGREPMEGLTPAVLGWECEGERLQDAAFARFEPQSLSVAPLDLEKLTVFVTPSEAAPPGSYRLIIQLTEDVETELRFQVLPEDQESTA